jgi:membrane-associated phospholipid phosphatase
VETDANTGGLDRLAAILTEVLSPAVIVILLPAVVGWQATGHDLVATGGWTLVVAVFFSVLPMVLLVRGARQGHWDGHWVRERERRLVPLLMCLASALVGVAILLVGSAPTDVFALACAMVATLVVCMVITRWWKVSIHAAVAGGAVAVVLLLYGPVTAPLLAVVALVCWARVRVAAHTAAQVVVGALVGPFVGGVVFLLLR